MNKTTASQEFITKLILEERLRQDEKWGADRDQDNFIWQVILAEEVGESAESVLKDDTANLQKELVQCAAVIYAWLESLDRQSGIGWDEGGRTPHALDAASAATAEHFSGSGIIPAGVAGSQPRQ